MSFLDKEDTVARMDRLEDMFHLVIQKKDSEIQGFKKTVNEMKLKIADLEFSLENANDRFEGVQLGEFNSTNYPICRTRWFTEKTNLYNNF